MLKLTLYFTTLICLLNVALASHFTGTYIEKDSKAGFKPSLLTIKHEGDGQMVGGFLLGTEDSYLHVELRGEGVYPHDLQGYYKIQEGELILDLEFSVSLNEGNNILIYRQPAFNDEIIMQRLSHDYQDENWTNAFVSTNSYASPPNAGNIQPSSGIVGEWQAILAGNQFTYTDVDSEISSGYDNYYSYNAKTTRKLTFCADGSYSYAYRKEVVHSSTYGGSTDVDTDSKEGFWSISTASSGEPILRIQLTDGDSKEYELKETANGFRLGTAKYKLSKKGVCGSLAPPAPARPSLPPNNSGGPPHQHKFLAKHRG